MSPASLEALTKASDTELMSILKYAIYLLMTKKVFKSRPALLHFCRLASKEFENPAGGL